MKYLFQTTLLFCIFCAHSTFSQVPGPKPPSELRKLDYFVGTWSIEAEYKAEDSAEKVTGTDRYEWMPGGFFLASHSEFKASDSEGSSLAIMGYSPEDETYTYDVFTSMGDIEHAKGNLQGDTWVWTAHARIGSKDTQSRFLLKILSPSSYTFQFVTTDDGLSWTKVLDGKASKVK